MKYSEALQQVKDLGLQADVFENTSKALMNANIAKDIPQKYHNAFRQLISLLGKSTIEHIKSWESYKTKKRKRLPMFRIMPQNLNMNEDDFVAFAEMLSDKYPQVFVVDLPNKKTAKSISMNYSHVGKQYWISTRWLDTIHAEQQTSRKTTTAETIDDWIPSIDNTDNQDDNDNKKKKKK